MSRINSIQIKGFRKILNVPATYVDRKYNNEELFKIGNGTVGIKNGKLHTIIPATEVVKTRRSTLLGHLIRAGAADPMHRIGFEDAHLGTVRAGTRRVGRPKKKWIDMTMEDAWGNIRTSPHEACVATVEQRHVIKKQSCLNCKSSRNKLGVPQRQVNSTSSIPSKKSTGPSRATRRRYSHGIPRLGKGIR